MRDKLSDSDLIQIVEREELYSAKVKPFQRNFFKIYTDILKVASYLTNPEFKFLIVLACEMDWNNKVILNQTTKIKLMSYLNLKKEQSIKNLISALCKKDFLKRIKSTEYVINNIFITKQPEPAVIEQKERNKEKRDAFLHKHISRK